MVEKKHVCLRRLANTAAERMSYERWIRNKAVTLGNLIETETKRISVQVSGRHVLALQDTTEFDYQAHAGRVKNLGTLGEKRNIGFLLHPLLVMDAQTGSCLGAGAIKIWTRSKEGKAHHHPRELLIEEKESYRWITTAEKGKKSLEKAKQVTLIGDRENDIYEYWDRIPDERTYVLTRGCHDRRLTNGKKIREYLNEMKASCCYQIEITREIRKKREKRLAELEIRYAEVEIRKPEHCKDRTAAKKIRLRVVWVKEEHPPEGEEGIDWLLLTTHPVEDVEKAKQIIEWYQRRWDIEQIFRLMKRQGMNIESSQVESGTNLMKLGVMGLCAAIKIFELVKAREGQTQQKTLEVFNEEEQALLKELLPTLEGKTQKQKNPYPAENLGWAAWIIARLGSWHGTKSEGLPGPIVMGRGLQRFYEIYIGWKLCRNV